MLESKITHLKCCGITLNWKNVPILDFILFGATCEICNTSYEKRSNGEVEYFGSSNETYRCSNCGEDIEGKRIIHFRDSEPHYFDLDNDFIQVSEIIPYCPKCETQPMNSWEIN